MKTQIRLLLKLAFAWLLTSSATAQTNPISSLPIATNLDGGDRLLVQTWNGNAYVTSQTFISNIVTGSLPAAVVTNWQDGAVLRRLSVYNGDPEVDTHLVFMRTNGAAEIESFATLTVDSESKLVVGGNGLGVPGTVAGNFVGDGNGLTNLSPYALSEATWVELKLGITARNNPDFPEVVFRANMEEGISLYSPLLANPTRFEMTPDGNVSAAGIFFGNGAEMTNIPPSGIVGTAVTNGQSLTLRTNTSPTVPAGFGTLWNSNGWLYWKTATTNALVAPR